MKKMQGRPFALVGVNSDADLEKLRSVVKEKELTWRSFWNGPEGTGGPISALWNVRGWPTIYIIDHEGVIRDKNKRGDDLDAVLEELVSKAEASAKGMDL
ncbi:MAG: hypothetical protein KDC38_12225 [Planctomycetes bacterium]|nr:hypothetical protein [Planctomycetota bacterium]